MVGTNCYNNKVPLNPFAAVSSKLIIIIATNYFVLGKIIIVNVKKINKIMVCKY